MTILGEAVNYLQLGWSVVPIRSRSKIASMPWKEFQDRRMSALEAVSAFRDESNIALVCGDISGVLVIDHDLYKKKVGESNLDVNTPLWATTPKGGKHYYFKYKDGGNTVNQSLAIDIRAKGGYVLLPPSVVDYEDGATGSYSWNITPTKEILDTLPFAPESLLLQLYTPTRPMDQTGIQTSPISQFDPSSGIGMGEGGRNSYISKWSLSTLNRMNGNIEASWKMILTMNATFNPPLPERELRATFESALKRYQASPPTKMTRQAEQQPVSVSPNFIATSFTQDLDKATQIFLEGRVKGESTGFPELDSIIGGYIPGQSYLVYADTSVGKSVFALTTLMELANRGIRSLYFDLENPMELTVERMAFVARKGELTLKRWREIGDASDREAIVDILAPLGKMNISVWDLNKLTDKYGDINWDGIKQCIEEEVKLGARFIVIDHLHYFSPSETDHAYLGEVMRQINNLCAIHGISILVVAHTKKGLIIIKNEKAKSLRPSIDYISGSGMISRHCKNVIALQRNVAAETVEERQRTTVYVDKTKYGPVGSFELEFLEQNLCFVQDPEGNAQRAQANDVFRELGVERPVDTKTVVTYEALPGSARPIVQPTEPAPAAKTPDVEEEYPPEVQKLIDAGLW